MIYLFIKYRQRLPHTALMVVPSSYHLADDTLCHRPVRFYRQCWHQEYTPGTVRYLPRTCGSVRRDIDYRYPDCSILYLRQCALFPMSGQHFNLYTLTRRIILSVARVKLIAINIGEEHTFLITRQDLMPATTKMAASSEAIII